MTTKKNKTIDFSDPNKDAKILPHSERQEAQILAQVLSNSDILDSIYKFLNMDGFFYNSMHKSMWVCIKNMSNNNMPISFISVSEHFRVLGDKHTSDYVLSLFTSTDYDLPAAKITTVCLKLSEYAIRRSITRMSEFIYHKSSDINEDVFDILGNVSDGINSVYQHLSGLKEKDIKDHAINLLKEIDTAQFNNGKILGLHSSLNGLNEVIKGYRNGNMVVIGATTGEGKTTLALQESIHFASNGYPVGYVSLEMSVSELLITSISAETKIHTSRIITGNLSENETARMIESLNRIKSLPINFLDSPGLRIGEIKSAARTWKKTKDIKALVIDHIHLVYDDIEHGSNTEQRFTNIANKLKELAKELDIPVIALAQLSRKEKSERMRKHVITDIKYAGGIEQAADVVLLIYRPYLHGNTEASPEDTAIIVGKLRLLDKRDVLCSFHGTYFKDYAVPFTPINKPNNPPPTPYNNQVPF